MSAYPFSVFKRSDRPYFLVAFKDEAGNYLSPISTKKKNEDEAREVAFKWLRDGIPQKQNIVRVNDLSMKEFLRKLDSESEVRKMLDELMRLGWLKNYILDKTPEAINLISFLNEFWDWETSPYIKEKLRKNRNYSVTS